MLSLLTHLLLYSWAEPNGPTSPRLRLSLPGGPPYLDHMVLAAVCGFHPWDPVPSLHPSAQLYGPPTPWSHSSYSLRTRDNPGQKLRLEVFITPKVRDHLVPWPLPM